MTTQTPTPTTTTTTRTRGIIAGAAAVIAGGALVGGLMFGLGGTGTTPASAAANIPAPAPAIHSIVIHDNTNHSMTPAPTPKPQPQPSSAVSTLQEELGQLNYYNGKIDGLMGPQTTAAITYLQRDAGLPQTGVMNTATNAALMNYLAHGNNQMAG
jgi:peptidoglycan hydrolase-like protein with peptidoglycan-binding domain